MLRSLAHYHKWLKQGNKKPHSSGVYYIGEPDITDLDGNADANCGASNSLKHGHTGHTSTFNNLKTVTPHLPDFPGKPIQLILTTKGLEILLRSEAFSLRPPKRK
jgi:hypothetical protein